MSEQPVEDRNCASFIRGQSAENVLEVLKYGIQVFERAEMTILKLTLKCKEIIRGHRWSNAPSSARTIGPMLVVSQISQF